MKKRLISVLTAFMSLLAVSCMYDDTFLRNRLDELENRVLTLEQLCEQMNTNISSLKQLVDAIQQHDFITRVTPIEQGGVNIGYTINFAIADPITIFHGKDGLDGTDGLAPEIGVEIGNDGIYYWTLNGKWMTDRCGNRITASANDGITPELKIEDDYWYISYDGGENWERMNKATGEDGVDGTNGTDGDSFFLDIIIEESYIEFILADGTSIIVERNPVFENEIQLRQAIAKGGTVILTGDVALSSPLNITTDVILKLGNYNITNPTDYVIENTGNLTIEADSGTIVGLGGIRSRGGTVTINGGTVSAASNWSTGTFHHIIKAENTEVVINGGIFDANVGGTNNAMLNASTGSVITINGGVFRNVPDGEQIPMFAPYLFTYENGGKVVINNGTFYGGWRFSNSSTVPATTEIYGGNFTVSYDGQSFYAGNNHILTIYGGIFSTLNGGKLNPSSYLAPGYKAIYDNNIYYVVPE